MNNLNKNRKKYRDTHKAELKISKKLYLKIRPWYSSYEKAKQRCIDIHNIQYPRYGGRGIKFNMTLQNFKDLWFRDKAYQMKMPSIDRINNDGNYIIENCRFIERSENTRRAHQIPVKQYSMSGDYIKTFLSSMDVERNTGISHSDIVRCRLGKARSAGGYRWA